MKRENYYLYKDKHTGELLYLEYKLIDGYEITPKTRIEDAIDVSKIVITNSTLQEKLIRKKLEIKLRYLFKKLEDFDDDDTSSGEVEETLLFAERLKVNILNKYIKYLGNTYGSFYIQKIDLIIKHLQIKLYNINRKNSLYDIYSNNQKRQDLYYLDEEEPKKGRGR